MNIRRHEVRLGLTGYNQIHGRNSSSWEEKFDYDVYYVAYVSFLMDWKIIFFTIKTVLKQEGISSASSVTMEKFTIQEKGVCDDTPIKMRLFVVGSSGDNILKNWQASAQLGISFIRIEKPNGGLYFTKPSISAHLKACKMMTTQNEKLLNLQRLDMDLHS